MPELLLLEEGNVNRVFIVLMLIFIHRKSYENEQLNIEYIFLNEEEIRMGYPTFKGFIKETFSFDISGFFLKNFVNLTTKNSLIDRIKRTDIGIDLFDKSEFLTLFYRIGERALRLYSSNIFFNLPIHLIDFTRKLIFPYVNKLEKKQINILEIYSGCGSLTIPIMKYLGENNPDSNFQVDFTYPNVEGQLYTEMMFNLGGYKEPIISEPPYDLILSSFPQEKAWDSLKSNSSMSDCLENIAYNIPSLLNPKGGCAFLFLPTTFVDSIDSEKCKEFIKYVEYVLFFPPEMFQSSQLPRIMVVINSQKNEKDIRVLSLDLSYYTSVHKKSVGEPQRYVRRKILALLGELEKFPSIKVNNWDDVKKVIYVCKKDYFPYKIQA